MLRSEIYPGSPSAHAQVSRIIKGRYVLGGGVVAVVVGDAVVGGVVVAVVDGEVEGGKLGRGPMSLVLDPGMLVVVVLLVLVVLVVGGTA